MMIYAKAYLKMKSAAPSDVAEFLVACLRTPYPKLDLTISCDSPASAGQTLRRIRQKLGERDVAVGQFSFRSGGSSLEIELPPPDEQQPEETEPDYEETGSAEAMAGPSETKDEDVPEGDYKARLLAYEADKRPDRHFARIKWIVEEGPYKNKSFEDLVQVWPPAERNRYFAQAMKVPPENLVPRLPSLVGTKVRVRRREGIRQDGSTIWLNNYYPLEWTPPPKW